MSKIFILFVFTLLSHFAFSQDQEARILFNDGTTIEGFGSIKKNKIYFRASLDDKADSWSYDMVKGITFSGFESTIKYEYVLLDEFSKPDPQLLEVVEEGNVVLYARIRESYMGATFYPTGFNSAGFNSVGFNVHSARIAPNHVVSYRGARENATVELYVKRANEKYPLSLNSGFYKRAAKYFSDCEVVSKKIDTGEFSKNKILEIVQYYNDICAE